MSTFNYPPYQLIAGVDEVGRGPLVGDVVTAAVILDPARPISGLNDSKKLSEKNATRCLILSAKTHWRLLLVVVLPLKLMSSIFCRPQ